MKLDDKIKGAIYGMALGDSLGLGTEFMTRQEVLRHYPEGLTHFRQFIRDAHRAVWRRGEWTNDTEVILLMLDSLMEKNRVSPSHMAKKLKEWYDSDPNDVVTVYRIVMSTPGWVENPIVVAHQAWRQRGLAEASNEALNRALIAGIMDDQPLDECTSHLVHITHDDSRCVAATAVMARIVRDLIYKDSESGYETLMKLCEEIDERGLVFIERARNWELEDLKLDDEETMWYTRKSMAAALWTLWHCDNPHDTLSLVVNAGGDADTNASLAMMIAGLKYGYDALPPIKEDICDRERLDDTSARLTAFIRARHPELD